MKLKATLISLISVLIVGAVAISLYCFWPAIKGTIDNSKYYTEEELQASYDKGFEDGCKTETELLGQIDYYKGIVDEYYIQVNTLNDEIAMLSDKNNDYVGQISSLNGIIEENESTIESLQSTISDNNTTISGLNTQISGLNSEIDSLESDIEDLQNELSQANEDYQILQAELTTKTNQVISLQNQVNNLQTLVNQLNATNELNLTTISTLNSQIETLNSQISDLTYQINNNDSTVASLNNQIAQLQESISYYENYISNLENETQVVVTFEFDGSVYNIQIVNKGATVSVVNPTSTDYVQFNYWTINEEQIDLSSYTFNTNTKVVADVTYSYDVTFYVDNAEHNTQIVEYGNKATTPTVPTKTGYTFLGWSLNGSDIVDLSTVTITENTNFYALFVQQFSVQFVYEDDVVSTQTINNGAYATSPSVESTTYKVFNGWKVNGTSVNVETYKIVGATTFVADITYKYDVTFMVDNEEYNTQIVTSGQYATVPTAPTKTDYEFVGWSIDGVNIVDISAQSITMNTTFIAVFEELDGGLFNSEGIRIMSWNDLINNDYLSLSDDGVLSAGTNVESLNGKLELSDEVVSIADSTFRDCSLLSEIILTDNVTSIGQFAFLNCTALTSVEIPSSVIEIGAAVFKDCSNLSYAKTPILSDRMFQDCTNLVDIDLIGENIKTIGTYTFGGCGFTEFVVPNGVTRISVSAFGRCENLLSLTIPESVTYASEVVTECRKIETIYYNAASISDFSFHSYGLLGMRAGIDGNGITIYIGNTVEKIPAYFIESNGNSYVPYFKNIIFEDNSICTEIGESAFEECKNLTSIVLPNSITTINDSCFCNSSLQSIKLSSNLNYLGKNVFAYCENLTSIYLPESLSTIVGNGSNSSSSNNSIFKGCSSDMIIYCGIDFKPTSWKTYWNSYASTSGLLEVKWGYTYEQYLAEIGA